MRACWSRWSTSGETHAGRSPRFSPTPTGFWLRMAARSRVAISSTISRGCSVRISSSLLAWGGRVGVLAQPSDTASEALSFAAATLAPYSAGALDDAAREIITKQLSEAPETSVTFHPRSLAQHEGASFLRIDDNDLPVLVQLGGAAPPPGFSEPLRRLQLNGAEAFVYP